MAVPYDFVRLAGILKYLSDFLVKWQPKVFINASLAKCIDGIIQLQDIAHPLTELAHYTETGRIDADFYKDFNLQFAKNWWKYFKNPGELKVNRAPLFLRLELLTRVWKLLTEAIEAQTSLRDELLIWKAFRSRYQDNLKKSWQDALMLYLYYPLSFGFTLAGAMAKTRIHVGKLTKITPSPSISYSEQITIVFNIKGQQIFYTLYLMSLCRIVLKESWKFFKAIIDIHTFTFPNPKTVLTISMIETALKKLNSLDSDNKTRIEAAQLLKLGNWGLHDTQKLSKQQIDLASEVIDALTRNLRPDKILESNVRQAAAEALLSWTTFIELDVHRPTLKSLTKILIHPHERSEIRDAARKIYQQLAFTKKHKNNGSQEFIVQRVVELLNSNAESVFREQAANCLYTLALLPETSASILNSIQQALKQAQNELSTGPQFKENLTSYLKKLAQQNAHHNNHAEALVIALPPTLIKKIIFTSKKTAEISTSFFAIISAIKDFQDDRSTGALALKESEKLLYAYQITQKHIRQATNLTSSKVLRSCQRFASFPL